MASITRAYTFRVMKEKVEEIMADSMYDPEYTPDLYRGAMTAAQSTISELDRQRELERIEQRMVERPETRQGLEQYQDFFNQAISRQQERVYEQQAMATAPMMWGTATRADWGSGILTTAPYGKPIKKESTARQKFLTKLRKKFKPSDKCLFALEKKAYAEVLCLR